MKDEKDASLKDMLVAEAEIRLKYFSYLHNMDTHVIATAFAGVFLDMIGIAFSSLEMDIEIYNDYRTAAIKQLQKEACGRAIDSGNAFLFELSRNNANGSFKIDCFSCFLDFSKFDDSLVQHFFKEKEALLNLKVFSSYDKNLNDRN